MASRLSGLPFIVVLMGIGAASMLLPAVHAFAVSDHRVARAFLQTGLLFLVLSAFIAIATANRPPDRDGRHNLTALAIAYIALPLMLAVPFQEAVGDTRFIDAYVEMVSSLTATGATFYAPEDLAPSVHLWRAQVGWMGGFLVWVTVAAVLAPLNLGGFEVRAAGGAGQGGPGLSRIARLSGGERLRRYAREFAPIYGVLTLVLWGALVIAGDTPLVALCHAMSTLSTSGISPVGGLDGAQSGIAGEVLILLFLVFAFSRVTFAREERPDGWRSVPRDAELRLAAAIILSVTVLLFLRHWVGALEQREGRDVIAGIEALWGSLFTAASFLSTAGFTSIHWDIAHAWSGLAAPGLILMGLAVFGGGVGTTAGGVKLLRVWALYIHGKHEIDRLIHPSTVGGSGPVNRRLRRHGAPLAWIFFMLFAFSIALGMTAFALAGQDFESALILTIAALSTTGTLVGVAGDTAYSLGTLGDAAKIIFAAAMVIGRLETLALIALLNPEFWRR
jgi:trk system potassium uptake protein TrkH